MRRVRCDTCRREDRRYCEHNHVLVVYIDDAPVTIVTAAGSEQKARVTADRLRLSMKGKPFNPPRAKQ